MVPVLRPFIKKSSSILYLFPSPVSMQHTLEPILTINEKKKSFNSMNEQQHTYVFTKKEKTSTASVDAPNECVTGELIFVGGESWGQLGRAENAIGRQYKLIKLAGTALITLLEPFRVLLPKCFGNLSRSINYFYQTNLVRKRFKRISINHRRMKTEKTGTNYLSNLVVLHVH